MVLASLPYIAIQVRDAKRAAMRAERRQMNNVLARLPLDTTELAHAIAKVSAVEGQGPLKQEFQQRYSFSDGELELYFIYLGYVWRDIENDFMTSLDKSQVELAIERRLAMPTFRKFIEDWGSRLYAEFIAVVERLKARIDAEREAT